MQQAEDFRAECHALGDLLQGQEPSIFNQRTQFKGWSIDDVIGHLHMFNVAARFTLEDSRKFDDFYAPVAATIAAGQSMLDAQANWLDGLQGPDLFDSWRAECENTADLYAQTDPKLRVKWAGPDMSARSSITARQMETWAHGQEIFDILGEPRADTDRIKNIAHLGVSTFGWTFINRREPVPDPAPHVQLTSPSGEIWEWNTPQPDNVVKGTATEFCQIVAQTRNVSDTKIETIGITAKRWMHIAQCFAGPPVTPPAPGSRYRIVA